MIPYRFRLSRKAGWSKPPGGAACGRPGPWGNPYIVGQPPPADGLAQPGSDSFAGMGPVPDRLDFPWAVNLFAADLYAGPGVGIVTFSVADLREQLAGLPCGCWCPLEARCHVHTILRAANGWPSTHKITNLEGPPWPTK